MPADSWTKKLEEIVGPANVSDQPDWFREQAWEGPLPQVIAFASTRDQVCEVMRLASAERLKVAPVGQGTKQGMAGASQAVELVLSLARLHRVVDYPASDLTISVEVGLPVRDLAANLASQNQMLPLDAPFADRATVGGALATNSTGPRRLAYGSWRDLVLGVQFVTAEGKLAKGGGKVVKNVAGYDLPKLLIGSCGTLGVIVEVAFKVFPIPPASATFVLGFATAEQALQASRRILSSPLIPQALDLVDAAAAGLGGQRSALPADCNLVVGVAGQDVVVERFQRELPSLVRADGLQSVQFLQGEQESALWRAIQELTPLFRNVHPDGVVLKASVPLTGMKYFIESAGKIAPQRNLFAANLARAGSGITYCYLWSGADGQRDAHPEILRKAVELLIAEAERLGGRAIVEWCPPGLKGKINLWGTLGDDFPWMQRVKAALDPQGILNPGRFYGGI